MSDFKKWCDKYWEENNNFPSADEAWNHQQKKIDAVLKILNDIYPYEYDLDTGVKIHKIKELLK